MPPNALPCQVYSITDIKQIIKNKILNIWQKEWKTSNTKLNEIKNHILPLPNNTLTWKEEVVINRLRIGHTRLIHAFLMKKEDLPMCPTCNDPMTVEQILTDCRKYKLQRQKFNLTHHLAENLNIDTTKILKFLKDTELLKKIQ
ncbi:Ribonuclease H1 [Aphis craccivora]|uniref:Ribonuclease H1 n=1 Tax=Aphis craccivora TaxID=307492 RepID=A0A6G0YAV3_APHCR|nr:Ribonuclease H1 [Aphis craccivora]